MLPVLAVLFAICLAAARGCPMLPVLVVLFAICLAAATILAITKRQDKPRSAQWLAALWTPERTTPHALRGKASGLRPMAAADWVVVEPAATFVPQMQLRRKLLDDPRTADRFYATQAKEDRAVLAAEREALEMLARHLERHGAASHRVVRGADGRAAAFVDELSKKRVDVDAARPLWTAARVVQEDFILLSPDGRFVGGCALFSFMEIGLRGEKGNMRLGEPMAFIHRNVPGFNDARGVGEKVAAFFKKLDTPQARSNWLLVGGGVSFWARSSPRNPPRRCPRRAWTRRATRSTTRGTAAPCRCSTARSIPGTGTCASSSRACRASPSRA